MPDSGARSARARALPHAARRDHRAWRRDTCLRSERLFNSLVLMASVASLLVYMACAMSVLVMRRRDGGLELR